MTSLEIEPPPALGLLRDFVNTREPQQGTDQLTSAAALRTWLVDRGLLPVDADLRDSDLRRAVEVREGLRAVLQARGGADVDAVDPVDTAAIEQLNRTLADLPVVLRFDAEGYALDAAARDPFDQAMRGLLDAVRRCHEDQTWDRLKVCVRETCRWAFVDASRNKVRRWCSMAGCGNHVKMKRAYARRQSPS
ncbi:CGNR zinc finger domain-containing protein [Nocardioides pantholopis]|uniref:CGNR zinc finger domain-containing protein n=1 Tax=Nocardioides pantholopis TaxID=2483798 RepID=UPI000F08AFC9|nr:CGNR zinc finger domain-containing protein [Nocardioides pantholopis]